MYIEVDLVFLLNRFPKIIHSGVELPTICQDGRLDRPAIFVYVSMAIATFLQNSLKLLLQFFTEPENILKFKDDAS